MRIGTWNLQGRWDDRHLALVESLGCEVLLLTEVSERVELPGTQLHRTALTMAPGRRWAAVASALPMLGLPDPHGASAMAEVAGLRICSSILPWRSCGTRLPWQGSTTAEKTEEAVAHLREAQPAVWGGDWNHAMTGREWSGSQRGRRSIREAVDHLALQLPTTMLPHQVEGLLSIDHVAVPATWSVTSVERHRALHSGTQISDHDAYVVDAVPTTC